MTSKLGKELKTKRIAESLSLRDLERIVGVSFSGLARIERGVGTPRDATVCRIAAWIESDKGAEKRERRGRPWVVTIEERLARIEARLGIDPR